MQIDLNADLGESFGAYKIGNDGEMLDIISSANIACGFHGGDANTMYRTVDLAGQKGIGIGAHPGFDDLWGFGRRQIRVDDPGDVERMVIYQIGALQAMATALQTRVSHFKLHGALSNMACVDERLAMAAATGAKRVAPELIFLVLPGSELENAGAALGLPMAREIFADRAYDDQGMLVPRSAPGAVIHDADTAAGRMVDFVRTGAITSQSGKQIKVDIDTICVHGDTPQAVAIATKVRSALANAGVTIAPLAETIRSRAT